MTAGFTAGIFGAIDAKMDGRHPGHGGRLITDVSMSLPQMNQDGPDCRYEVFRSMDTYYNGETSTVADLRNTTTGFPNAETSDYQLQRMYNSKRMALIDIKTPSMTKYEIAQKMASSMQQGRAIHYEFLITPTEGHAVGITRVRIWDNGKVLVNFMNPSGIGGYSTRNFRQIYNIFSIFR